MLLASLLNIPSGVGLVVWIYLPTNPEEKRWNIALFGLLYHGYGNPVLKYNLHVN